MGKPTGKDEACPGCRSAGGDKSGNHLMIFEDGGKFCNRCSLTISKEGNILVSGTHNYQGEEEVSVPKDSDEPEVIPFSPSKGFESVGSVSSADPGSFDSLKFRKIPDEVRRKYGVTTEVGTNKQPIAQYYPVYVDGKQFTWKKRVLPKDFYALDSWKGEKVNFFGQHLFGGEKLLIICEGEEDAMAAYHMAGKKYNMACVSLPTGANTKAITDNMTWLKKFKGIYLVADMDDAGEKVTRDIAKLLPTIKVVTMSEKDPCDMLKESKQKEFQNDIFKAEVYKPDSIVAAADVIAGALVKPEWGLDYPFDSLTKMTYGLRLKRIIGLGAGPGAGKTCFVKALQKHLMYQHKQKIGVFDLEGTPSECLREMAGYVMNKDLSKPDTKYAEADLKNVLNDFKDKIMMYNPENYKDWPDIEEAIRYMRSQGVQWFFIDPLSALTTHLSSSDANEYLGNAMWQMSKMVHSLDCTIFHVNHLNNPKTGGKDHGAGGKVYASQFTGSRAQWKYSTDIWGLERDQYADDDDERNTTHFVTLKYRKPSLPGKFDLIYDDKTGTLSETKGGAFSPV